MANLKKFDSINVVPFIDVMLVLLTIVLTVATFVAQGIIPINLPESGSKIAKEIKSVEIALKDDGKIYFQNKEVNGESLKQKVATLTKNDRIVIKSDSNATVQLFVDVVDLLKERELENISILTKSK